MKKRPQFKCNLCGVDFDNRHECSVKTLKEQNQIMRIALEFYAEPINYETNVADQWEPVVPINKDNGNIARDVLKEMGHLE